MLLVCSLISSIIADITAFKYLTLGNILSQLARLIVNAIELI
ncbi:hypothetical protein [Floridanema evergladense]|uniref:Uncharacterized protein n=1 Tax=Floridaenema evergladense BLCC-F167 TaxID=3153639 RepID=A0ABV4WRF5_9CYAN